MIGHPSRLDVLKDLQLNYIGRSCDILELGFGEWLIRTNRFGPRKGEAREITRYYLHIQCPWRLDGPAATITGRSDLYTYVGPGEEPADFSPDFRNCLLDRKCSELFGYQRGMAKIRANWTIGQDHFIVRTVEETSFGELRIGFTPDYTLSVFPAGTDGECWRFMTDFGPKTESLPLGHDSEHYVFPEEPDE